MGTTAGCCGLRKVEDVYLFLSESKKNQKVNDIYSVHSVIHILRAAMFIADWSASYFTWLNDLSFRR